MRIYCQNDKQFIKDYKFYIKTDVSENLNSNINFFYPLLMLNVLIFNVRFLLIPKGLCN
jgi:hypothetical protein